LHIDVSLLPFSPFKLPASRDPRRREDTGSLIALQSRAGVLILSPPTRRARPAA